MINRVFTVSLLLTLTAFQFSCSQTNTAGVNSANTNANVVANNAANINASNANLNAEVVDVKTYRDSLIAQAEMLGQSYKNGDVEKFLDQTHPKVFEMAGGRDVLKKQLKDGFDDLKTEGYNIVSYTVGEPKDAVTVEKELFVVVPIVLVARDPKGAFRNESTLIAASNDNGASWKFLSDMNQQRFKALFPAAATKLVIPEDKIVPVAQK